MLGGRLINGNSRGGGRGACPLATNSDSSACSKIMFVVTTETMVIMKPSVTHMAGMAHRASTERCATPVGAAMPPPFKITPVLEMGIRAGVFFPKSDSNVNSSSPLNCLRLDGDTMAKTNQGRALLCSSIVCSALTALVMFIYFVGTLPHIQTSSSESQ